VCILNHRDALGPDRLEAVRTAGTKAASAYRQGITDGTLEQGQSLAATAHLLVQRQSPGRETSDGEQGQTNLWCRSCPLVYTSIQTPRDTILAAPWIPPASFTAGVYSKIQWQVTTARYSDGHCQLHLTAGRIWDGRRSAIHFIHFEANALKCSRSGV